MRGVRPGLLPVEVGVGELLRTWGSTAGVQRDPGIDPICLSCALLHHCGAGTAFAAPMSRDRSKPLPGDSCAGPGAGL